MLLQYNRPNFDTLQIEVEEQRALIARLTTALTLSEAELSRAKQVKPARKNATSSWRDSQTAEGTAGTATRATTRTERQSPIQQEGQL